jgi:8-oxo-dGTP diphosphatase
VRDAEGRCLIIRRSGASKHNAGGWDLPGGKVDAGEAPDAALVREVAEETGLTIDIVRVAGAAESEAPDRKIAYLIFEASASGREVRLSSEHDGFEWVPPSRLTAYNLSSQFGSFISEFARRERDKTKL